MVDLVQLNMVGLSCKDVSGLMSCMASCVVAVGETWRLESGGSRRFVIDCKAGSKNNSDPAAIPLDNSRHLSLNHQIPSRQSQSPKQL